MLISLFTVESRARQIVIHDINNNLKELPVPTILA
jgi:hypothetical protein